MKKLLSLLLACLMLITLLTACKKEETPPIGNTEASGSDSTASKDNNDETDGPNDEDEIDTVLRFVISSDNHLSSNTDSVEYTRLVNLYENAYKYANRLSYNNIDGFFFAGDITDQGDDESLKLFFDTVKEKTKDTTTSLAVMGNHEFNSNKNSIEDARKAFTDASGYTSADTHTTLNGYHFILMSPDYMQGWGFSDEKLAWLDAELQKAAADDASGKKPIFVIQHEPAEGTVYGAKSGNIIDGVQADGLDKLKTVLDKYPQAVDFSGHSHFDINDPRSIWQDTFTAVNTGGMQYLAHTIHGVDGTVVSTDTNGKWSYDKPIPFTNGGQFWIVEVSKDHEITLKRYDVDADKLCSTVELGAVGDKTKFTFTNDRATSSETPYFADGAEIKKVTVADTALAFSFPQAVCKDNVESYRCELYKGSDIVETQYLMSCTFYTPVPESFSLSFVQGITPKTDYTLKITPVSSWGKEGTPLTLDVSTTNGFDVNDPAPSPDVFELDLSDGTAKNGVDDSTLRASTNGAPAITINTTLNTNVINTNTNTEANKVNYQYTGMASKYDSIKSTVTMEVVFRLERYPAGGNNFCILSNQQGGGLGIYLSNDGSLGFTVHNGSDYQRVISAPLSPDFFYHVVGTYDGSSLKLYINGALIAEKAVSGNIKFPSNAAAQYMCIAGDSSGDAGGDAQFIGEIAAANIYSSALTETQIQTQYNKYIVDHNFN